VKRWIVYQRERFPLAGHAPLVAAFSVSAVSFSHLLRRQEGWPGGKSLIIAFVTALLFFLLLRISDEFKDFDDDSRYRPYRPVPRGLVTLRELAWIGLGAGAIQLALALWLAPGLVWLLLLAWGYLAIMSREFFVPDWLKARPSIYLASHMVIIPLIDLYATGCDWLVAGLSWPPDGLYLFLLVSFFNGIVVEVGRKIRAPEDEERGVETYTAVWGRRRAITVWLLAAMTTAVFAWLAARQIRFERPVLFLLVSLLIACTAIAIRFLRQPTKGAGKIIEVASGVWTLVMYLGLGAVPALVAGGPPS
jgi:4-hydroxybenzoate polyprenyltransferase